MERRQFLKSAGLMTAGTVASPFILPSGRLFARTMERKVDHVVFCLFAGGVRNMEAIHQNEGNLMPSLLEGAPSSAPGLQALPPSPYPNVLQKEAVLFREFRYSQGPTGHFNGHTVALTGAYTNTGLNLRAHPQAPTVFEYYLKHNAPAVTARNAWWISNALGPYPALNYSTHPDYGPLYGANHIAPTILLSNELYPYVGNAKTFQFHEEEKIGGVRTLLNRNFAQQINSTDTGMRNEPADAEAIRTFVQDVFDRGNQGAFTQPLGLSGQLANNDIYTILFAEEVIQRFQPELLVVNMTDIDACHQNYSAYLNNLQKADYAVSHLWKTIQETPGMQDNTLLVIAPEHGRNLEPNTVRDIYGRFGVDHTGDPTSREIFAMFLGPKGIINQNLSIGTASQPIGESIDLVPTIAHALGFDTAIPSGMLPGRVLNEVFV